MFLRKYLYKMTPRGMMSASKFYLKKKIVKEEYIFRWLVVRNKVFMQIACTYRESQSHRICKTTLLE